MPSEVSVLSVIVNLFSVYSYTEENKRDEDNDNELK